MKLIPGSALVLAVFVCGSACEDSRGPVSVPPPPLSVAETNTPYLKRAQPKLRTMTLWVGKEEIEAELAFSRIEIATGMMFRETMGENEGMLFVFPEPHQASFYMRNTKIPLSCAYISPDGTILEIHDMTPLDESPIEADTDQVQYVLEMRQGWFDDHQVRTGMLVVTEVGPLTETFFPSPSRR